MFFQKTIEARVRNKWLAENLKYLPLTILINLLLTIIHLIFLASGLQKTSDGFTFADSISKPDFWFHEIVISQIDLLLIVLCTVNVVFFIERIKWLTNSPTILFIFKIIGVFIGVSIGTIISFYINSVISPYKTTNLKWNGNPIGLLEVNLIINNFFSFLICIPIFITQIRNQGMKIKLKEKELQLNKAEVTKTQAQLEALQSKINPHFLYNALNSIASLAHEEPDKVEKMAISLSKLFRYSITTSSNNHATIQEETDIIRTYLDIEKIRFGDKLNYSIKIDANPSIRIPRFLIQPLVENAVKHGTSKITNAGFIEVTITAHNNELIITVHDNGPAFPEGLISGYGLQSTQEKLNLLFPSNHELSFANGEHKQLIIKLKNIQQ